MSARALQNRLPWLRYVPTLAVVALALALRLYHLGAESLWLDEIAQVQAAQAPLSGLLAAARAHHGAAPLDYLITALLARFSLAEWALRLPSALWGTLAVLWLVRLGRRLHWPAAGLIAALLLAIHPLHLRYSQEVRFYALFLLLALVATEALWRAWERRSLGAWATYAIVALLGLYSHYFAALVLLYHSLWVLWRWAQTRRSDGAANRQLLCFAAAGLLIGLAFTPWLLYAGLGEGGAAAFTPPALSWSLVEEVLIAFGGGETLNWLWPALAGLGLLALWRRRPADGALLLAWAGLSLPLVVLIDRQGQYFFHVRQVLFVLPIYLLLVGAGVTAAARLLAGWWGRRAWSGATLACAIPVLALAIWLALLLWPGLGRFYAQPQREDWRALGAMLEANLSDEELVVLINPEPYIRFYSPRAWEQAVSGWRLSHLTRAYETGRPLWVVETPFIGQTPDAPALRRWLAAHPAATIGFGGEMKLHYMQQGRSQQVLWETARDFNYPQTAPALASRAAIMGHLGLLDEALATYEEALALPQTVESRAGQIAARGDLQAQSGRTDQALASYEAAIELAPAWAVPYVNMGRLLLEEGRNGEASAALDTALSLGRDDFWVQRWLGLALLRQGDAAAALLHLQRALELDPSAHDTRYLIGGAYAGLGNWAEAQQAWAGYRQRQPDGPWINEIERRIRERDAEF